jgi:PAS domain S-box-containing protein
MSSHRSLKPFPFRPLRDGVAVGLVVFLSTLLGIWWTYLKARDNLMENVRGDLHEYAMIAAGLLDGEPADLHRTLTTPGQIGSPEHRKVLEPLLRMHRALPEISYIYTTIQKDGSVYFILDTTTSAAELHLTRPVQPSVIMDRYEKPDASLLAALHDGKVHTMESPQRDEFGVFMSGYAPFYDSQGRMAGVAGVDMGVKDLNKRIAHLHIGGITASGIALCLALGAGLVVAGLRKKNIVEEARHRSLVNNLREIVFQSDPKGRCVFLNEVWEKITGFSIADSLGKIMIDFCHPDDRARIQEIRRQILANEKDSCQTVVRCITKDGDFRWMELFLRPLLGGDRRVAGISGTLNDITQRHKAEEDSRLNEERLKLALGSSDQGLWDWDMMSGQVYYDVQWAHIHGLNPRQMAGEIETWYSSMHPEDRLHVLRELETHHRGERDVFEAEYRARYLDDGWIWVRARGRVIDRDLNWTPRRMIGTIEDISPRKEFEAELHRAKDEAEAADRAKGEFLAVMSHEIRTPLNGVLGFTDILLDTRLDLSQREFVDTIRNCAQSLLTLINDILDFSRIESSNLELESLPLKLRSCMEEAVSMCSQTASSKRIELVCDLADGVPEWVTGDALRLRQILANLVSNAVKFTTKGEVVLMAIPAAPGQINFSVRDTGIGIPEDRLDRLFKPFSQADSSTTRRYGGTGLGLAICKRLVEAMGGVIGVESREGEGSIFSFTVPLPAAQPHETLREAALLDGLAVLVVDDNVTNRRALHHILHRWRMRITSVESAAAALERLRAGESFDLALVDYMMPEMDGIELVRAIREFLPSAQLPIAMLSSFCHADIALKARAAGVQATINKPVRHSQLYDVMVRVLENAGRLHRPKEPVVSNSVVGTLAIQLGEKLPLRILLAEDQPVNQKIADLMLKKLGYTADMVANGREVIRAVKNTPYDLVLMDLHMPEMDGFEATREIRLLEASDPARPRLHIIALTADAMAGDREKCIEAGMDDYITKPLRPQALRSALQHFAQG